MDGWREGGVYGCMNIWMGEWMDGQMEGWRDTWMGEWMDARMDGWMDDGSPGLWAVSLYTHSLLGHRTHQVLLLRAKLHSVDCTHFIALEKRTKLVGHGSWEKLYKMKTWS